MDRPEGSPGSGDFGDEPEVDVAETGPVTEGVRIAAVEAAVVAGLAPSTTRGSSVRPTPGDVDDAAGIPEAPPLPGYGLPDWSDPPTGQVPRVLLDERRGDDRPSNGATTLQPTWREGAGDWGAVDLSFLVEGASGGVAGRGAPEGSDDHFGFTFGSLEVPAPPGSSQGRYPPVSHDDAAWTELISQPVEIVRIPPDTPGGLEPEELVDLAAAPRRRHARARHGLRRGRSAEVLGSDAPFVGSEADAWLAPLPAEGAAPAPGGDEVPEYVPEHAAPQVGTAVAERGGRSVGMALGTGLGFGVVVLICLLAGPLPTVVLLSLIVVLATGELLGALRRGGLHPAALVALVASPALMVVAYQRGPDACVPVLVIALGLTWCWLLAERSRRAPAVDVGATLLVLVWVGVFASYAGSMLSPHVFADRRGMAVLVSVIVLVVGNDVGAYAAGSRFGRHRLAPRTSPGKSWEGLIGGSVLTLALAAAIAARIHPLDAGSALLLGLVVCVLAPLGDLCESLVKRDLGLKDMGGLLPAHGGLLDRVDSLLLVLPAAYYLAVGLHLR